MKPVKIYVSGKDKYVPLPRWKKFLQDAFMVAWVGFVVLLSIATWLFLLVAWPVILPIWFMVVVAMIFVESQDK